jgi:hypothetical protein
MHYSACVHVVHILNTQYYCLSAGHTTFIYACDRSITARSPRPAQPRFSSPWSPISVLSIAESASSRTAFKNGQIGDRRDHFNRHPLIFTSHLEIPRPGLSRSITLHRPLCITNIRYASHSYANPCPRAMCLDLTSPASRRWGHLNRARSLSTRRLVLTDSEWNTILGLH